MPRLVDLRCPQCGDEVEDFFVMEMPDRFVHYECDVEMEIVWFGFGKNRKQNAQWSDKDSVVVFLDQKTGKPRYPGRNTAPTPSGYDRHVMRSLREVERFERNHGVRNEAMHFDRGSGNGFDDWQNGSKLSH